MGTWLVMNDQAKKMDSFQIYTHQLAYKLRNQIKVGNGNV